MVGVALLAIFTMACFSAITFSRVASVKAKEEAIVMDFLSHYTELVRALPYAAVATGNAINPALDGDGDSPDIRIPASDSWVPLNTADFEAFHPDLLWIHNRSPQAQISLAPEQVAGVLHAKRLTLKVQWDAPLRRGGRLQQQAFLVRVQDL
jgi:hypothetical protein